MGASALAPEAPPPNSASPSAPAAQQSASSPAPDVGWPMYNQSYDAQRFSALDQINVRNVGELKEACRQRMGEVGSFGGSPIVVDGVMYVTFGNATVALNPVDCAVRWKTIYVPEQGAPLGPANRGVAYFEGRLFRGTGDGRLLALDAANGRELWRVKIADPLAAEGLNAAPIVWDRKVFIGLSGSEFGIRGRMLALDVDTGATRWQFNTVPQGTEFGVDTWKGDSWRTGGGGTWSTFSLDPATGEVFVPVGNPAPDFHLSHRAARNKLGDNLFTNSVVALNARNGQLGWYFQATPTDDRDLDQAGAPMLFTLADGRNALAAASKDGYLRVIDRATHRLIYRTQVTTIRNTGKPVTAKGVEACPGTLGGAQWNGPALDTREKAIVVGAVDWCSLVQRDDTVEYAQGKGFFGGRFSQIMDPPPSGWITSVNADSGAVRWKFHAPAPVVGAITPTAGGITFAGDLAGNFYALRSEDGQVLLNVPTGGAIAGGIVTYTVGSKQYVAITSGNLSRTAWISMGLPHIIIYAIGGASAEATLASAAKNVNVDRGAGAFIRSCAACHGFGGVGATGPSLKGIGKRLSPEQLAGQVRAPRPLANGSAATMPAFPPGVLPEQDAADVVAYLETL